MGPKKIGSDFRISLDDGTGNFVPLRPISSKPNRIRCAPTPGPDGVRYVPDWYGLTEFG